MRARPFAEYQILKILVNTLKMHRDTYLFRRGCSRLVHQEDTMITENQLQDRSYSRHSRTHTRAYGTLESAKDEAEYNEASKVVKGGTDHARDSPSEETECDPSVHRESYQSVNRKWLLFTSARYLRYRGVDSRKRAGQSR
jgi:hypothetical protein